MKLEFINNSRQELFNSFEEVSQKQISDCQNYIPLYNNLNTFDKNETQHLKCNHIIQKLNESKSYNIFNCVVKNLAFSSLSSCINSCIKLESYVKLKSEGVPVPVL